MADYADLEIRILERQEEGYPVEMTLDGEQEFPRGYLDPEGLPLAPSLSPAEDGARLFACLLADERLKTSWAEMRGQAPQRNAAGRHVTSTAHDVGSVTTRRTPSRRLI